MKNNLSEDLMAKITMKNANSDEISINTGNEDLLIIISFAPEEITATGWQKDPETSDMNEIKLDLIDLQRTLYKRLGGLDIKENIENNAPGEERTQEKDNFFANHKNKLQIL